MGMFLAVMVAATAASVLLGAIIGILAKNQQAATSIGVPVSVILGFTPMIANFNETVGNIASFMYTQQLNVIVNDFSAGFPKAMAVIGANMLVLLGLFVFAYRKKGLK
jgi:ABC-2 type transport system permease protein